MIFFTFEDSPGNFESKIAVPTFLCETKEVREGGGGRGVGEERRGRFLASK